MTIKNVMKVYRLLLLQKLHLCLRKFTDFTILLSLLNFIMKFQIGISES